MTKLRTFVPGIHGGLVWQSMKIACMEEIAFRSGFIDRERLLGLAKSGYRVFLTELADSGVIAEQ